MDFTCFLFRVENDFMRRQVMNSTYTFGALKDSDHVF